MFSMFTSALHSAAGEEIEQLWHEYEQGQTPAAQLVKDFDKVLVMAHSVMPRLVLHRTYMFPKPSFACCMPN